MVLTIGIDPGVNTGWAVYDVKGKKFTEITTYKLHQALFRLIELLQDNNTITLTIEDARIATYHRNDKESQSRLKGAGSVMRDSKIWEEFAKDYNINYSLRRPSKQVNAFCENVKIWQGYTNYYKRTSHHARIAALLALHSNIVDLTTDRNKI